MKMPIQQNNPDVGFQIAPMIDVVFVILVFFMSLAAQIKIEKILMTTLPGVASSSASTEFFDEQILQISEDGEVTLNDEAYGSSQSSDLSDLTGTLIKLKTSSDAAKSKLVVTLISHPDSVYSRTTDVLNSLLIAGISTVTFTSNSEE